MKNRSMVILMAVLVLACGLAAAESVPAETAAPIVPAIELPAPEAGEIIEIPVDQDSSKNAIPPHDECYLFDPDTNEVVGYADPSITVTFGKGRIYDTDYLYARVKIASASQMRTLLASPLGNINFTPGHDLAKQVKAVFAINGDFPGGDEYTRRTKGAYMRQGKMLRLKCDEQSDVLVVDKNGDLRVLLNAKNEDVEALQDEALNIFTFGPALVVDGRPYYEFNPEVGNGPNRNVQRMALCQTGPLEYLMITCEGPENPGSTGLTIPQFIDLVSSIPEVRTAYNLDGGSSCAMVFRLGEKKWQKVNATSASKVRQLKDIIYFASAWVPAPEPAAVPEE